MPDYVNISQNNIVGECKSTCSFSFNFSAMNNCIAVNSEGVIFISQTKANTKDLPVILNGTKMYFAFSMIASASGYLYNGKIVAGELIIFFVTENGSSLLQITIPIISGNCSLPSTNILTNIINDLAKLSPKPNPKTYLQLETLNLNDILPKKPYYYWSDSFYTYIIYGLEHAIILDEDTITTISDITEQPPNNKSTLMQLKNPEIYFNYNGPGTTTDSDDIYIDCQPINASEESVDLSMDNKLSKYKHKDIKKVFLEIFYNEWFQLFLLICTITLLYYIIKNIIKIGDVKILKT